RVERVRHRGDVVVETSEPKRIDEIAVVRLPAHLQVLAERRAPQPRDLRGVRDSRWDEHRPGVVDGDAVPPNGAGLRGEQPEDRSYQRRLARADRTGDDDQLAVIDGQRG